MIRLVILCRHSSNSGFAKMHPQEIEMYERCLSHNWHRERMHGGKDFHFNTNECICLSWVSKRNWNRSRTKLLQSLMIEMQSSVFVYTRWNMEKSKPRIQKYFSQSLASDENGVVEWIVWRIMINMRIGDTGNWQIQEHWQEAVNEQTRNRRIWWDDLIESPNPTNKPNPINFWLWAFDLSKSWGRFWKG